MFEIVHVFVPVLNGGVLWMGGFLDTIGLPAVIRPSGFFSVVLFFFWL